MKFGQFMYDHEIKVFINKFYKKCSLETSARSFCIYKELNTTIAGKWKFWNKLIV